MTCVIVGAEYRARQDYRYACITKAEIGGSIRAEFRNGDAITFPWREFSSRFFPSDHTMKGKNP